MSSGAYLLARKDSNISDQVSLRPEVACETVGGGRARAGMGVELFLFAAAPQHLGGARTQTAFAALRALVQGARLLLQAALGRLRCPPTHASYTRP